MQKRLSEVAVNILLETGVYVSPKAVTSKEYELMRKAKTCFYQNTAREGVTVG